MPIWLRKYTFSEIKKYYEEKAAIEEKAAKGKNTKSLIDSDGKVNPKNFANIPKQPKGKSSYK